jgi:hypothetical protein
MSRDEATQKAAAIEWTHEHGAPEPRRAARAAVQDWHACALDGEAVARSARRRSDVLRTTTGARILVKQFLAREIGRAHV